MSNISYLNTADGTTTEYLKARGTGTDVDPFIPIRDVADTPQTFTETQLTAPGTTTSRDARGYQFLQFLLTVANINDSLDVRVEGSPDNSTWFPLGEDYVIRQNGNDMITFAYPQPLHYVRLNWVSEAGGTNATLNVITVIQ
jgi:hypothetical protein